MLQQVSKRQAIAERLPDWAMPEAGVAKASVKETEGETTGKDGNNKSGARKWMQLVAQLTDRLCWHNQLIPNTAEASGSNGVTRKVTRIV